MALMSEQTCATTIENKQAVPAPDSPDSHHQTETTAMDLDVNGPITNKEESSTASLQEPITLSSSENQPLVNGDQKFIAAPPSPPVPTPPLPRPLRISIDGTQNLSDLHITSPPANLTTVNVEDADINSSPTQKVEEVISPGTKMDMDEPISPLTTITPSSNPHPSASDNNSKSNAIKGSVMPIDEEMADAPPIAKAARDREEDEEDLGRPAKRAKTDELPDEKQPFTSNHVSISGEGKTVMPKAQAKHALASIRIVKRVREAGPFLQPVDPEKLKIPTYFDYVKEPMDLSTMEKKLQADQYATVEEFTKDFNLIISNCLHFNGQDHQVSEMARKIQAVFEKQMEKMPPPDQTEPEKKSHKKGASSKSSSAKAKSLEPKTEPESAPSAPSAPPVLPALTAPPALPSTSAPSAPAKVAAKSLKEQKSSSKKGSKSSVNPTATPAFALAPSGIPQIRRESTSQGDGRPKREIHPPPPRDLPYTDIKPRRKKTAVELKFCENVMKELMKKQHEAFAYPFYVPVDPVALNIPEYFKIIKKPMDLSTVQHKLKTNQYDNANEFEADAKLMLSNCFKFNPVGTPVHVMGKKLEELFYKKWAEKASFIQSQSGSRSPVSASPPPGEEEEMSEDEPETNDIATLENELAALKNKLSKMKQKEKKQKSAPPAAASKTKNSKTSGGGGRKSSVSAHNPPAPKKSSSKKSNSKKEEDFKHISLAEKLELSERINLLPPAKMVTAMAMIQQNMPNLAGESVDEIELDIDELPPAVLYKLYQYVFKHTPSLPQKEQYIAPHIAESSAPEQKAAPRAKKNKPMSALEQEAKIKALSEKLNDFENPSAAKPHTPVAKAESDSESSEEDESSSSESEAE